MNFRPIALCLLMLCSAVASAQQSIVLVRHAELEGGQAMATPKALPLSALGEERAKRLASLLKDTGIGAIYVTDFVRSIKTGEPIAMELKKEPVILPKGDPAELVARLRKEHAGDNVLLVGHTDTLPGLLKALGHPEDIKIESNDYGNVFVVTPKGEGAPGFLRLRY